MCHQLSCPQYLFLARFSPSRTSCPMKTEKGNAVADITNHSQSLPITLKWAKKKKNPIFSTHWVPTSPPPSLLCWVHYEYRPRPDMAGLLHRSPRSYQKWIVDLTVRAAVHKGHFKALTSLLTISQLLVMMRIWRHHEIATFSGSSSEEGLAQHLPPGSRIWALIESFKILANLLFRDKDKLPEKRHLVCPLRCVLSTCTCYVSGSNLNPRETIPPGLNETQTCLFQVHIPSRAHYPWAPILPMTNSFTEAIMA